VTAQPRTVLLTGASGFVGQPASHALLARGFEVHAISRRARPATGNGITWHNADLLDANARREVFARARPTHLVHLAWYVEHGKFWTAPQSADWLEASLDLLRLFGENGGRRAVLSGTSAEYDWARDSMVPVRETDPCRPSTPYGRAKLALFERGSKLAEETGFSFAWARFFLMFGFGEDPRRFIPLIVHGLLAGEPIALTSGRQVRDFLDTRDVGAALAGILESAIRGPVNVGSGRGTSLREAGAMLAAITGRSEKLLQFGALLDREGEPKSLVAGITRLTGETGYKLNRTLEQRLGEYVEWHWQHARQG